VVVNCGAIPESLVESELFGHERGAFTGADRLRKGKFEVAVGGTIFLDEIGELSLASQSRLLHVLQDREIERLGGEGRRIPIDVRVIAATNRDLAKMVSSRTFRQDLFFRLNVISIRVPALRERPDDIPLLANHFALKCAVQAGRPVSGISPDALSLLQRYSWPGNVRELENTIEGAIAMGETDQLLPRDFPDFPSAPPSESEPATRFYDALELAARDVCTSALRASKGNCTRAANLLGLHRNSLYRLIHKHGLERLLD
jgi:transcriptional regulator with PAS, ATPase and Fis domain